MPSLVHIAGGELVDIPGIRYGNQQHALSRYFVRSSLRSADLITTPSGPVRRMLENRFPPLKGKVRQWAPGVDADMFAPGHNQAKHLEGAPFRFITVGSLIPVKGHDLLLKALARLMETDPDVRCHLTIVGEGPLASQLLAKAHTLGLTGYVDFIGGVRHEQLPAYLRAADAFVLTSLYEAQCLAAIEAMCCGLPWISTPVGSLRDCAASEVGAKSGQVLKSHQVGELASAMKAMATSPGEHRQAQGVAARSYATSNFELAEQTAKLAALLRGLTGRASGC